MRYRQAFFSTFAALLMLSSCTPTIYNMEVQVRKASASGLDLVGKSMSIVSLRSGNDSDTLFTKTVAESLATSLENEFFASKQAVALYELPARQGVSYGVRDSLVSLVMQTGSDVVFLQGVPRLETDENGRTIFQTDVYVYDSMDKKDRVRMFHYSDVLSEDSAKVASRFATNVAARVLPAWETTYLPLYYFDDSDFWIEALELCDKGQWSKAMDKWMSRVSKGSAISRACAAYNIAAACYSMGNMTLAQQWLDAAADYANLEAAPKLRRKIANMLTNHNK